MDSDYGTATSYIPANDWPTIVATMERRRMERGVLLTAMMQVRERYNGEWVIPDLGDSMGPLTPTLITNAIDHLGLRAASVMPNIAAPALEAGKATGVRSTEYAAKRRRAWSYVWEKSQLHLHLRRAYRHIAGYATTALVGVWDFDAECPKILVRDPLHAYPETKAAEDLSPPSDCGFVYGKSVGWLKSHYPAQTAHLQPGDGMGELFDVVEWIDSDSIVLGVLGPRWGSGGVGYIEAQPVELRRWPNRAGRCTVVVPQRLTLDRIASQVAQVVGHSDLMARLMALDIIATEKAIVPDRYIIGKSAMMPQLVGNRWKDGREGEINTILDADAVGELRGSPDPNNQRTIDRLERNASVSAGLNPTYNGETMGSLRTGRGIDSMLAASADPRVQEMQEIMAEGLTEANHIVADLFLGYAPDKKYEVFSGWDADAHMVDFTPKTHFGECKVNRVAYPLPGTDVVSQNVVLGQLVGTEMMSKRSARMRHPYVTDPDTEERQIVAEKLRLAMETQLLTRASDPTGGITPMDLARIAELIEEGQPLHTAIQTAQTEAQQRQAAQAPPPDPGQALPPEMMAGLANPGEGAEMQPPPGVVPGPNQNMQNLDQIINSMLSPATRV